LARSVCGGEDGAQAAWLLAQHADRRPELQQVLLEAMRAAVKAGEAAPADLAYLEDRVRVNAGRPQLYGTQFVGAGEDSRRRRSRNRTALTNGVPPSGYSPLSIMKPTCAI
jgi:hypothetical protein